MMNSFQTQEPDTHMELSDDDNSVTDPCSVQFSERTAASFLLSYNEKFKLPQKTIDYAVGSIIQS